MSAFFLYSKQSSVAPLLTYLNIPCGITLPTEQAEIVIQWDDGQLSSSDPSIHVLNSSEALDNAASKSRVLELLKLNGIPVIEERNVSKLTTVRRYFVPVFGQEELAIYRSVGKKVWLTDQLKTSMNDTYEEIERDLSLREIRKVVQYAVRSIYAVGLDFGGVLLGVGLNGKIHVIDVTATPKLNDELAVKYARCIESYVLQYKRLPSQQVVLGADPEFVLRNKESGKMVLASRFFTKQGRVGCDHIWLRSDQTRKKLPLAELRPQPAKDPRQLAINLYKTMLLAEKKISQQSVEWLAGGMPMQGYPIGGHIHFSQTWLNSSFLRALDNYLTLPMMLLENDHSLSRRPKYGFLGDFRKQFHGGFEYRTLPSWLVSPKITKAVFAMAKLIAEAYPLLKEAPTLDPSVQRAFYHGDKMKILNVVVPLWQDIENLPEYEKYARYIRPFQHMVLNIEEWDEFRDIRQAWRIPPFSTTEARSML
jgi:hypothetical protein